MNQRRWLDPDDLFQLIVQYGQDFGYEYGYDEYGAFAGYAANYSDESKAAALLALDELLATTTTEADLERRLDQMAFAYVVQTGGSPTYRDFLLRLRGWLVESLEERPPGPVPEDGH